METMVCDSPKSQNDRHRRYLILPVLAVLFQLIPPSLLWVVSTAAYREPRWMSEAWEQPLSILILALSAGVSTTLGSLSVYALLRWARPRLAAIMIILCCLPALFGGAIYLHGLLVFLAWI